MTSYSRQDVLRILQISTHQLQGWERAGLIPQQQSYTFQDLGQLRTLRILREDDVPAASIRDSILAMKAVAGMANPLLEACLVRTGTRLAFRHHGAMVDPIRRQLLFDFERFEKPDQFDRDSALAPIRPRSEIRPPSPTASRNDSLPRFRQKNPAKKAAPSLSTKRFSNSIRTMRRPASTSARCTSIFASMPGLKSSTAAPP